jgi:hypothetical protein
MARSDPFVKVRWEAERLLKEIGITGLPVDPFKIAKQLGISLMAMPANTGGASGMLLHVNGQFGIGYPTHVESEGFKRFSVSHEIGHYRLPGHVDAIVDATGRHLSRAGFVTDDTYEREADHFASALLMPTGPFTAELRRAGEGLAAVEKVAALCGTSLEATAIRYAQCARDPVAVIRSAGRSIDYAFMSAALMDFPGLDWIRKGTPLSVDTVTYRFNADAENIRKAARDNGSSALQDWFGGPHRQEVVEEVVGLGSYGKALTILSGMEQPDEPDDEDNDDDLEEAWTPRFRR